MCECLKGDDTQRTEFGTVGHRDRKSLSMKCLCLSMQIHTVYTPTEMP